jgi:hypothetical protein
MEGKRIALIKLIAELDPKKDHIDESYVHCLEGAEDFIIESFYDSCFNSDDWKETYPSRAIYLKRLIDHL